MANPPPTAFRFVQLALASLALVAAASLATRAGAATAADFLHASVTKQGAEPNDLPYRYYVPELYDEGDGPYPLIVFLHGSGERGNNNTSQLNNNANGAMTLVSDANQAAHPALMLAPQASVAEGWNANTLAQVVRAITALQATFDIDPNRIYVTGLSMGGAGTWDITRRYPFLFAAAAPICGWGAGEYGKLTSLPIWAFHAVNDGTVSVAGSDNAVSAVRQVGGRVIYTRYATGGHGIWTAAYTNPHLLPWMMAQRRNQPAAGTPIIAVTSPGSGILPPPGSASLAIAGTATIPGGIMEVRWTTAPWTGMAGITPDTYTLATGTDAWSAGAVPNSASFLVVATTGTWSSLGGTTTINDLLWKPATTANTTAPAVAFTTPSASGSHTTGALSLDFAGTAAGAGGKTIQGITWSNDRGGSGIGVGTTSWTIQSVDLQPGPNIITVTARDSHSITGTTTIRVQVTTSSGPARLLNLSARAFAGTGDATLIPGFVISGTGTKRLLIRAVGPPLAAHGIAVPLADPRLVLKRFDSATQTYVDLAANDDWGLSANASTIATTAATVGAFAIPSDGRDAALLLDLAPGHYSAFATDTAGRSGIALVELYDADAVSSTAHLINISNRGRVGIGENIMIPGFVISEGDARTVLIRAVGPGLVQHGVVDVLADPRLTIFARAPGATEDTEVASSDDWDNSGTIAVTAAQVGAFGLNPGSKDAALVVTLPPGVYTAQASGVGGSSGVALVEVYLVP